MIIVKTVLTQTPEDKKRARAVKSAEENRERHETPKFFVYGNGVCNRIENADDFTEDSRRPAGYRARGRAKAICGSCPFAADCLAWAVTSGQTGVFGGEWMSNGVIDRRM